MMWAAARLLVPLSTMLLGFWMIATVLGVDNGWPAELGSVGDPQDVAGEWAARGTLFSPPLAAMVAQAALTALALAPRPAAQLTAGGGLAVLGCLYLIGGFGDPLDPAASDPNVVANVLLRAAGVVGAAALAATGVAAAGVAWRRR